MVGKELRVHRDKKSADLGSMQAADHSGASGAPITKEVEVNKDIFRIILQNAHILRL